MSSLFTRHVAISFDGLDCTGKTFFAEYFYEWLCSKTESKVLLTKEPVSKSYNTCSGFLVDRLRLQANTEVPFLLEPESYDIPNILVKDRSFLSSYSSILADDMYLVKYPEGLSSEISGLYIPNIRVSVNQMVYPDTVTPTSTVVKNHTLDEEYSLYKNICTELKKESKILTLDSYKNLKDFYETHYIFTHRIRVRLLDRSRLDKLCKSLYAALILANNRRLQVNMSCPSDYTLSGNFNDYLESVV